MEKVQQPSGKKPRVESPSVGVKEVLEEGQPSGGAGAMVAMEAAAPIAEEHVVCVDKDELHCPRCSVPLKPPIFQFQCDAGHVACNTCHGLLPKNKCYSCHQDGSYGRSAVLEGIVGSARICPNHAYGCRSYVTYHAAADHQRACPHAPCRCSEPGCGFLGSPPELRDHLRDAHAWPVDKVRYGEMHHLRLPESQPRRLLVAEDDDGRVFLVSASAHAGGARHGVAVACVRAAAACLFRVVIIP
ncbi:unnamed protein product [Urochloa decumbens]|uniref:SIAH-type domain-containing protein n=1 Tax=Urochloa decumbens TaxID=240449 RepID=A0ABC8YVU2_9POAL